MKKKINIGFFSIMLTEKNGVAIAAKRLIQGFSKANHNIHVFAPENGLGNLKGVSFHKVGGFQMSRNPKFYFALPLTRYFNNRHSYYKDIDICHSNTPLTLAALALDVAKLNGLPKIITHHSCLAFYSKEYFPVIGKFFSLYAWHYERFIYNRFHVVQVPTISKKRLIQDHKIKEPIFALTNGIPDHYFKKDLSAKSEILDYYKIPQDKKILLYAGRMGPEKNIKSKIRALYNIRKQNINAHLILAGGGPQMNELLNYAKKYKVDNHLTQTGWVEQKWLKKIYAATDINLLFNEIEAQGLVLLESMAQGTPCVGQRSFGIKDVILDGETGYLVNDEKEFYKKIVDLLKDDELRKIMGRNAIQHVQKKHKMSNVIKTWEKIYSFILDEIYPLHHSHIKEKKIVEEWRAFSKKELMIRM